MTETSRTHLERLYRLQEILTELKTKTERRGRTPDHLVHIEAAFQDSNRRRDQVGAQLKEAQARKRALEMEIEDFAEQARKYQAQLSSVKTNREYGALLNEVDNVKREIRLREDELLNIEEALQTAQGESLELETRYPDEFQAFETEMKGWREEQQALDDEIRSAETRAAEIRASVDKKLLAIFDRIAKSRAGVAIARVIVVPTSSTNQTAACAVCNVKLRPQLLADLRLARETVMCESCKRILFWDASQHA